VSTVELRPDITVAAAKLTSGFDVSRELRQLGAHLRDGEIVHRLAAGVYGSGGGLLAVTNRRVLLLRDGRGGQASEGYPLELLNTVDWVAGPARGTIIVGDADNASELTQVEPVEGTSVVKLIRSLVPQDAFGDADPGHAGLGEHEDDYDEYDELADAGEDALLTHGTPAMSGARSGARRASGGEDAGDQAARSGRFAVTMKLRQPRSTPRGATTRSDPDRLLPEQKSASERSAPTRAVRRAATGSDRPDTAPSGRRSSSTVGFPAGAVPVSALGGSAPADLDRPAAAPEQQPEQYAAERRGQRLESTGGTRRAGAGSSRSGGHSAVPAAPSIEGSGALGTKLVGEVPVHKLAEETGGQSAVSRIDDRPARLDEDRPVRFDDERPSRYADDERPARFDTDRDGRPSRFDADRDDRESRSGADRAERPARFDSDRDEHFDEERPGRSEDRRGGGLDRDRDEVPSRFDESRPSRLDDLRPSRAEERRGRPDDRRRTMYDEDSGEFRRTRTAIDSGPIAATGPRPRTGSRGTSGSQRSELDGRSRGTADEDGYDGGSRRSKWLWIGGVAATVAALGAVGGVALLHHSDSPTTVNPAPAASDSLAGPVVRVSKIVDGDTIEVTGPVSGLVEIVGISAPRSDKGQCGASASTAFASRTLAGTNVTLVSDPSLPATDKSGRKLASLRTDNGFDYAVLAAGAGMARYYDNGTPVAQAQDIKNAQAEAEKADRGLWGSPCNGKLTTSGSAGSPSTAKSASTTSEGSNSSSSRSGSTSSSTEPGSTGTTR